eukprot:51347-Pyramimonas_sp.AAC.1
MANGFLPLMGAQLPSQNLAVVLAASQKSYLEAEVAHALRTTFQNAMADYVSHRQDRHVSVNEVVERSADDDFRDEEIDALIAAEPAPPDEASSESGAI